MAWNMFHDRQDTAREHPLGGSAAKPRHLKRVLAVSAIADDAMGAGDRNIEHRQAIDIDAKPVQIRRHDLRDPKD